MILAYDCLLLIQRCPYKLARIEPSRSLEVYVVAGRLRNLLADFQNGFYEAMKNSRSYNLLA